MTEKVIQLEGIDPIDLYGSGNSNIGRISSKFPKLKVIARGSAIKVMGEASEIDRFDRKLTELIDYFSRYGHLSREVIDQIYDGGMPNHDELPDQETIVYGNNGVVVRARTVNQQRLVKLYEHNDLLFAVGPAGSGKTYTAIALAVRALRNKEVKRIILTRPAVEAGEKLGFLPGDMKEKLDPYLQPLYDALDDMIPPAKLHKYLEEGTVQIAPLAFMRGRTLDNAFVILDEAQNTTLSQIKMFLTRMGRSARFIVTGDLTQIDLAKKSDSGLSTVMKMLRGIDGIGMVEFDNRDIIRHRLVKYIIEAFDQQAKAQEPELFSDGTESSATHRSAVPSNAANTAPVAPVAKEDNGKASNAPSYATSTDTTATKPGTKKKSTKGKS